MAMMKILDTWIHSNFRIGAAEASARHLNSDELPSLVIHIMVPGGVCGLPRPCYKYLHLHGPDLHPSSLNCDYEDSMSFESLRSENGCICDDLVTVQVAWEPQTRGWCLNEDNLREVCDLNL